MDQFIDSSLISIVLQGVLPKHDKLTDLIGAYRRILPQAQYIVSAWKGSGLSSDGTFILIESDDPGYFRDDSHNFNVNRQIVSTNAGLARATRPFVLKVRLDMKITSAFKKFLCPLTPVSPGKYALYSKKIRIIDVFTRDPELIPYLFHPSDIVLFGKTEDIKAFWNIPLAQPSDFLIEPEFETVKNVACWSSSLPARLVPEQYFTLRNLERLIDEPCFAYQHALSYENYRLSCSFMSANFDVMSTHDSGVLLPERIIRAASRRPTLFTATKLKSLEGRNAFQWRIGYLRALLNKAMMTVWRATKKLLRSRSSESSLHRRVL